MTDTAKGEPLTDEGLAASARVDDLDVTAPCPLGPV
jgi:hypothetical protein